MLDPDNRAEYIDDSGVGNTLNGNHTIVRRMIMDSLRYWVQQYMWMVFASNTPAGAYAARTANP